MRTSLLDGSLFEDYGYTELFAEAVSILKENGVVENPKIESLVEYYRYLDKLIQYGGPKFLRIPLSEKEFEINLDTREIIVPEEISNKTNPSWVVGVAGDHRAEILWFVVNRFFDGQDLAVCFPLEGAEKKDDLGRTYVVWVNGKAREMDPVSYVEITENEIHFGWPLRQEVLHQDGDLTFAISFNYHEKLLDDGSAPDHTVNPRYSFNTKEATVNIKKNITHFMGETINDLKQLSVEETSDQDIMCPRFSGIYNSTLGPRPILLVDLVSPVDLDDETGTATLTVTAEPVGTDATLQYRWYKNSVLVEGNNTNTYVADSVGKYQVQIGNNYRDGAIRWLDSTETDIPVAADLKFADMGNLGNQAYIAGSALAQNLVVTVEQTNDAWYRKIGDVHYSWYKTDLDGSNEVELETNYKNENEQHTYAISYAPTSIGNYYIRMYNKHNKSDSKILESSICTVKAPAVSPTKVDIERNADGNLEVVNVEIENNYDLRYKWYYSDETGKEVSTGWNTNKVYTPQQNGSYYCKVKQVVFADNPLLMTDSGDATAEQSNIISINDL